MHMLLSILCKSGITKDTPTNEFSQSMKLHSQYCPRLHGLSSSQTHSRINDSSYSRDTSGTTLSSCLVLMSCLRSDCWKLELSRTIWKLHESDSNNEKVFTAEYNSTCTTNNSVFHSLPFFSKQKKLQNAANVILGQQSETRKLLTFDEFELFYALLLHMSLVKKVPDTHSSDTLLTFSGFDRQCEAIAQHSLLQYVHRDVVLVCK